jgi:dephospho-CoA kinase
MKWTGLTGSIATGKSTAKKLIESLGYPVIDADQISHKLSERGERGYIEILSQFGSDILNTDLSIDRKKLGQMIFNNARLKSQLEAILHPMIQAEVKDLRNKYEEQGAPLCFYDVPLLFEKNLQAHFDATVLVWCDSRVQLVRLMKRNQLTEEEALLRVNNQWPLVEKVKRADYCIDNSGDFNDLEKQLKKLINTLV